MVAHDASYLNNMISVEYLRTTKKDLPFLLPFLILIFVNLSLGYFVGVSYRSDTTRYMTGAEQLLSDQQLSGTQTAYIGYVAVLALAKTVGLGEWE